MKMKIGAAMLALTLASAPAAAADMTTLGCVANGVDAASRARIGAALLKGDSQLANADLDHLSTFAAGCQQRNGWSDAAMEAATQFAVASMLLDHLEGVIVADGIDPNRLTGLFHSLSAEERAGFAQEEIADASVQAFIAAAAKEGIDLDAGDHAEHAGGYAAALALSEQSRAQFAER